MIKNIGSFVFAAGIAFVSTAMLGGSAQGALDPFTLTSSTSSAAPAKTTVTNAVAVPATATPKTVSKPKVWYVSCYDSQTIDGSKADIAYFGVSLQTASPGNIYVSFYTLNGTNGVAGKQYVSKSQQMEFKQGAKVEFAEIRTLKQPAGSPHTQTFYVKLTDNLNATIVDPKGECTIVNK